MMKCTIDVCVCMDVHVYVCMYVYIYTEIYINYTFMYIIHTCCLFVGPFSFKYLSDLKFSCALKPAERSLNKQPSNVKQTFTTFHEILIGS